MNKDSSIYVAGHRGLVGSAIMRELDRQGYTNILTRTSAELDLRDQAAADAFFEKEKPEYVFLAAAKVGGILANNTYKADFIYDNILLATNTIGAAHKYGVKKLLNLGSSCIYPKLAGQPLTEDMLLSGRLEETNEPYAIAKIAAIKLCRYFNEQYGTDFISLMPCNLYGMEDNYNFETSHVLPALVRKFILAEMYARGDNKAIGRDLESRKLGFGLDEEFSASGDIDRVMSALGIDAEGMTLWGDGSPMREFLFADDLATACLHFMASSTGSFSAEFLNIGSGTDISIRDLALMIKEKTAYGGVIRFDASKPNGTPKKLLDVSKANAAGWEYSVSLSQGLDMVIDSYRKTI